MMDGGCLRLCKGGVGGWGWFRRISKVLSGGLGWGLGVLRDKIYREESKFNSGFFCCL